MAKILVVDDSELICQVTKGYLEPLGHQISSLKSGKGLLSAIEKEKPQLVILDVHLPDASGFNICQQLRENGCKVPILLSSASNAFGPWADHLAQGFLFKPYTEQALRLKVEALLEHPEEIAVREPADLSWDTPVVLVHHLRNSVGCLSGLLEMFNAKPDDEIFRKQYIRLSQQAVDNSAALLEEFSTLSHHVELKREPLHLELWLNNLVKKHAISSSPKISLRWQIDAASLSPLSADSASLARAVNAILDNAVEAMPEGGALTIGAHGDAEKRRDYLIFQDTGVGMDGYALEHAVVPFFTTKANQRGVGLSWAQKIILEHGGKLEIASTIKKGTSVSIKIPVGAVAEE